MTNIVDLPSGIALVVTDLHGDWQAYARYRDHFLTLFHNQQADYFLLLGDLIHGYGQPDEDASLSMVQDVMRLQDELGADRVIPLLGNHELPHIYGVTLSKGDQLFTPRFEYAMGDSRPTFLEFFKTLPFMIRTSGGVLLMHAGATASHATAQSAEFITNFSHQTLLDETDQLLNRGDVQELIGRYLNMTLEEYDNAARFYLAATGVEDERYYDLLRGFIVSNLHEWQLIWDFFFNQCETGISPKFYQQVLRKFLAVYATPEVTPQVLVTGHMSTRGGYALVDEQHLRVSSWSHASPKDEGCCLLFDVAAPVARAEDLLQGIQPLP